MRWSKPFGVDFISQLDAKLGDNQSKIAWIKAIRQGVFIGRLKSFLGHLANAY